MCLEYAALSDLSLLASSETFESHVAYICKNVRNPTSLHINFDITVDISAYTYSQFGNCSWRLEC